MTNRFFLILKTSFMVIVFLGLGAPLKTGSDAGENKEEAVIGRVHFEDQADLNLLAQSLDVWEVDHDQFSLVAYLTPFEYFQLVAGGYQVEIDPDQTSRMKQTIQPLADQTSGIPGFPCYRTVEETYTSLGQVAAEVPQLATWIDIGDSWEKFSSGGVQGNDIYTLVLTNSAISGPKPKFFLMAAIHAREYATAELAARFAEYLVENYGTNPDITWLLDYSEVHILPIANPDGRKIAEGGIYWRKNTNDTDGCSNTNLWGTDLNRNSSFKWGLVGASQDACDETFRGSAPASESETRALQEYLAGIFTDMRGSGDQDPAPIDTAGLLITLHSYGESILYPWGWTPEPAPNQIPLRTLGRKFGFYSAYQVCQSGEPGCIYLTSGSSDDWAYGELGLPAYTFEVGTSFFESCSYFEEQILPEQFPALLYAFKAARLPYQNPSGPDSIDLQLSAQRVAPGAGLHLSFTADDTRYSSTGWGDEPSQTIAAARFSLGWPSWISGSENIDLLPADGTFDSPQEIFTAAIDTSDLEMGKQVIFVESQDADESWGVPSAAFFWISPVEFQPDFSPDISYGQGPPGSKSIFHLQVTNMGTQDDTFDIQVGSNSWPVILSSSTVGPLIPGQSSLVKIEVSIPGSAQTGEQDLAILVATSRGNPAQFTSAQVLTSTRPPRLYLPQISNHH